MGRRSLATNPRVPWAMHAVVHVMEMQRRFEDAAWLRLHQPAGLKPTPLPAICGGTSRSFAWAAAACAAG